MKIGSDVPDVTWTAFRCLLRLGKPRPSRIPTTIATTIHTGKNRSRNESRRTTGTFGSPSRTAGSKTTSLTTPTALRVGESLAARRSGHDFTCTGIRAAGRGAVRSRSDRRRVRSVGEDRVDLPTVPVGTANPHLVLDRVATGRLFFDLGLETSGGEVVGSFGDLLGRENLDTEVVDGTRLPPSLDQHQLEWWLVNGKVRVTGADLRGRGSEQRGVEVNRLVEIRDIER